MNIRVTPVWPTLFRAIDEDTYDGAPDSKCNHVGLGLTEEAAIANLEEQILTRREHLRDKHG